MIENVRVSFVGFEFVGDDAKEKRRNEMRERNVGTETIFFFFGW